MVEWWTLAVLLTAITVLTNGVKNLLQIELNFSDSLEAIGTRFAKYIGKTWIRLGTEIDNKLISI